MVARAMSEPTDARRRPARAPSRCPPAGGRRQGGSRPRCWSSPAAARCPAPPCSPASAALRAGAGKLQIATARERRRRRSASPCPRRGSSASPKPRGRPRPRLAAARARSAGRRDAIGCGLPATARRSTAARRPARGAGGDMPLVLDAAALGCLPDAPSAVPRWPGGARSLLPHARRDGAAAGLRAGGGRGRSARRRRAAPRAASARSPWSKGRTATSSRPDGRAFRFEGGGVGLATSGSGDVARRHRRRPRRARRRLR